MKLILGSASVGRKSVLEKAGYDFEVMISGIDEKVIRSNNFEQLPMLLAKAKAEALLQKIKEPALLITSDQVVVHNKQLREKPSDRQQAKEYLLTVHKHPSQTNTAVVVTNTQTRKQSQTLNIATVYFRKIPDQVVEQLLEEGKVMQAAGGFIVNNPLIRPYVLHIEGTEDSVIGLPLVITQQLLAEVSE